MYNSILIYNNQKYLIITASISGYLTDINIFNRCVKTNELSKRKWESKENITESLWKYIFNGYRDIKKCLIIYWALAKQAAIIFLKSILIALFLLQPINIKIYQIIHPRIKSKICLNKNLLLLTV